MKVIFLDIDGVLNLFTDGKDKWGYNFNTDLVNNFQWLIDRSGAKIVISSSWKNWGLTWLKSMWEDRGLRGEIIDITPNDVIISPLDYIEGVDRGLEIKQWLLNNPAVKEWIIIDDVSDMLPEQADKFIKCEKQTGLTRELAWKAIQLLIFKTDYYCLNSEKQRPKCKRQCGRCKKIENI